MQRYLLSNILLLALSAVCSFSALAQSQAADSTSLREGAWALQFGIASNFTLTSFQGTTIAAKYQFSPMSAIRGGITINGSTSSGSNSTAETVADTNYGAVPGSSSSNSSSIAFVIQYLWYMAPSGPVHFYAGLGPNFGYAHSHRNSDNSALYNINSSESWVRSVSASGSNQWSVGATGSVGVEWFATRWLSLHADYFEAVQYQWGSSSSSSDYSSAISTYIPSHTNNSGTSTGWILSNSSVSFGLNIYL